jgi:(p)ppGpp synthase/HD superfamily hydrolase
MFATGAHGAVGQKRKYTGEDYITHPARVATLVQSVTDEPVIIAAAWLHDVVEDTQVTLEQIGYHFGYEVETLVEQLTDVSQPTDGNRAVRRALDLEHTAKTTPNAKTIKLADLIDNSSTIVKYDPAFAKVYMAEKRALLVVLTEGHPSLYKWAKQIADDYFETHA